MTTVLVHNECPHCTSLVQWMLETIPMKYRDEITFKNQTTMEYTSKVPAILCDDDSFFGEAMCKEYLLHRYPTYIHEEVDNKKEAKRSVEEQFNDLVSQRKPMGRGCSTPELSAPPRATPSL